MLRPPNTCHVSRAVIAAWLLTALSIPVVEGATRVTVGIVADGQAKRCFVCTSLIVDEIRALTSGEFDVRFPDAKRIIGDWSRASVADGLDRLLRDREVDLVLALGPVAAVEAGARGPLPKPVIAPVVIDPDLQGLPRVRDATGVRNFTYVAPVKSFERDVAAFRRVVAFERLAIVVDRGLLEALPALRALAAATAARFGFEALLVAADDNVYDLLASLPSGIDAVFVTPLLRFDETALRALAVGLRARRLPSFSFLGRVEVELGLLVSMAADDDGQRLARRVALDVQRILLGEDAGTLGVSISQRERLVINMDTLRGVGVSPSWDVLTEALRLNDAPDTGPGLTLRRAMNEALEANLGLAVNRFAIDLAEDDRALAGSRRGPQLELGAGAVVVDEDRAAASFGQQPERSTNASATLTQLLYDDGVNADVDIAAERMQAARSDVAAAELDTVLDAALAFLEVLRARSVERIRVENLETTRANLDLATLREAIGTSGPSEAIRWEREIADNLKSLAESRSERRRAESRLNVLLNRPPARPVKLVDLAVADAELLATDPRVLARVDNPLDLEVFTAFMVGEGLANAAELESLRAAIAAQQRALRAARRTRWPTVAAQASIDNRLSEGGAGAEGAREAGDTEWSVGLNLTLPLFQGGGIGAGTDKSRRELLQLRAREAQLRERIEARVVDAMFSLHATFPSVEYAAASAQAAQRNLANVADAYSQGVVSILDLLDAQTAALASNEAAASAEYALLADFFVLQRAVGRFDYFLSEAERGAWFARLREAFAAAGR